MPDIDDDTLERIRAMYERDPIFSARFEQALINDATASSATEQDKSKHGFNAALFEGAAKLLRSNDGPRIAVLEVGGWDTHANQGTITGSLANRLTRLDNSLATLQTELGDVWQHTAVLMITEFGRTVAVNGTRGTDHGTAGCAFLAGGAVKGGRVLADWPGLRSQDLYQERDLYPTRDLNAFIKGVLHEHLSVPTSALAKSVFPNSVTAPVEDLIVDQKHS
ncbi:MAG: DUF1501 domain-containing protein [Gammaproteobacteria bacterium]|nr:DUF1501 domain-containing protein [Gammaproteobacteria bacterium]